MPNDYKHMQLTFAFDIHFSHTQISLELGGNAPFIVFDDADLDLALTALMAAKFRNAGQACIASNRILVQEGVYDKFAAMLTAAAGNLVTGDGFHDATHMGPLINQGGLDKVSECRYLHTYL